MRKVIDRLVFRERNRERLLTEQLREVRAELWSLEHLFVPGDRIIGDDDRVYEVKSEVDADDCVAVGAADGSLRRVNRFAFDLATKADV